MMTEQVQQPSGGLDVAKLVAAILIVVAGVVGFYYLSEQTLWVRWLIVLAAVVLGIFVALQSAQGKELWTFVQSSRVELRKVVWPTRQETLQVTLLVFVVVIVMGVFFWALDWALGSLTQWLTGRGA
jgi:preprotein translocase subunit SecE